MAAAFAPKPKKQTDFSTKTDAELDAAETSLSKTASNGKPSGFATGLVLKAIQAEKARRAAAKPPATPPAPDAAQAASQGAKQAQTASVRQKKKSVAGAAGFVAPQMGLGSIAVMPMMTPTSLLGG